MNNSVANSNDDSCEQVIALNDNMYINAFNLYNLISTLLTLMLHVNIDYIYIGPKDRVEATLKSYAEGDDYDYQPSS